MKLVYDIETDGFDATKVWCLVAHNLDSGTTYKFSDYDDSLPGMDDGCAVLNNAEVLMGHNIIGFDIFIHIFYYITEPPLEQPNLKCLSLLSKLFIPSLVYGWLQGGISDP